MDLDDLPFGEPSTPPNLGAPPPRKCRRHEWHQGIAHPEYTVCLRCGIERDPIRSRRNRANRTRGNRAELDVARAVGGRKVGPLGHPWDVELPGYARLQVRKLARPPSIADIVKALNAIGSGPEMPGYVWIEPGRGGEQLITFRLRDYAAHHGIGEELTK